MLVGVLGLCFSLTKRVKEGIQKMKALVDRPGTKNSLIYLPLGELLFEDEQYD